MSNFFDLDLLEPGLWLFGLTLLQFGILARILNKADKNDGTV